MIRVGVVGARGHVGAELLPILFRHPSLQVAWVTSQSAPGSAVPGSSLLFRDARPELLDEDRVDAVILALPNGESAAWADRAKGSVVVDLSTDHRFDADWVYAQPERFRDAIRGAKRLAAPGCYATAAQLAVAPIARDIEGPVHVFGISGWSGAGTAKSERNDPEVLRDNVLPYSLVGHAHERELQRHLGRTVYFVPHVAPFFRGLVVTASFELASPTTKHDLDARFAAAYGAERFVTITEQPPRPRDAVGRHDVRVGGITIDTEGRHAVVVAALDNLLGGAASQAVRGLNLALGLEEGLGL